MFNDGKAYERMMGRWSKRVGVQFLEWLAAPKGLNWVEVGCGNGAFTEELIAYCAPSAVSAVDPSEGQLSFARTRPAAKLAQFRLARRTGAAISRPQLRRRSDGAGHHVYSRSGQGSARNGARGTARRPRRYLYVGHAKRRRAAGADRDGIAITWQELSGAGRTPPPRCERTCKHSGRRQDCKRSRRG